MVEHAIPRLGARFPNTGQSGERNGFAELAVAAESAGVESLHLADHLVLPDPVASVYPFSPDGTFRFSPATPWYEAMAVAGWVLAVTERLEVGPSVMVLPQRHPVEVAKVAATLDALSGGRLFLGVGAGWMAEEFEVLGWDFASRFARMDESLRVMRHLWAGLAEPFPGDHFDLPGGLNSYPLPVRGRVPAFYGGMSTKGIQRAVDLYDGWIAIIEPGDPDFDGVEASLIELENRLAAAGRPRSDFRAVIRLVTQSGTPSLDPLPGVAARVSRMGFDEVVVDPLWNSAAEGVDALQSVRSAMESAARDAT